MNYSAKASSKHLLNRVGSRPKINYSRFNLKDKKIYSELLRLDTLDLIGSCNDNRLITQLVYYQPKIKYTHISKTTKNVPKLNLVRYFI